MEECNSHLDTHPSSSRDRYSAHSHCSLASPEDSGTDEGIEEIPSTSYAVENNSVATSAITNSMATIVDSNSITTVVENNSGAVRKSSSRLDPKYEEKKRKYKYRTKVLKYILFALNLFSWVVAVIAIVISYYILLGTKKVVTEAIEFILDPAIVLFIVASITFLMAVFGCIGTIKGNRYLLRVFYIMLGFMIIIELIFGVLIWLLFSAPVSTEKFMDVPRQRLTLALHKYKDDRKLKAWIDSIQTEFKCCGISHSEYGYRDWQANIYFNCSRFNPSSERCAVPMSCCIFKYGDLRNEMCGFDITDKERHAVNHRIYTQGCLKGFRNWFHKNEILITILAALFIAPQIAIVLLARTQVKFMRYKKAAVKPPTQL
ncbi:tetraspanin-33-like isoform X1 [Octopus sinensis]|uniref:Tetraspanin-33 n=2 Tax=Octopus sinensis TaxID=2607531 RepID=A0A7E6ENA9_9MOLL|nr:tetraspanin-33-like isoform X1 [Octopus sinensis]